MNPSSLKIIVLKRFRRFVKEFEDEKGSVPSANEINKRALELLRKNQLSVSKPTGKIPEIQK